MNDCKLWILHILFCALVTGKQWTNDANNFYRDFKMPGVSPQVKDAYICTSMLLNSTEEWIIRYEPLASANRAHHMLLYGCSDVSHMNNKGYWDCGHHGVCSDSRIIYAWAKNAPSTNLPDNVGFRIGTNFGVKYLVLQIHYATAVDPKVQDYSGLKMLTTTTRQKYKAGIYLLAKGYLLIPPHREKLHGDINCVVNLSDNINLFAFRVHAHKLGAVITGYKYDQDTKELVQIAKGNPQWPQSFYPTEKIFSIKQNDVLHARCTFNSTQRDRNTLIGATSADEMCNLYLMYYTDRDNGPDSGFCGFEQFPKLTNSLPADSDQPLPNNEDLKKQTIGENTNKHKEISYQKLFKSTHTNIIENEVYNKSENGRTVIKPTPVKVNSGYTAMKSNDVTEKIQHDRVETKLNQKSETEFRLEKNWGPDGYKLGQVSGVAVDCNEDVVIFHRGDRVWDSTSFNGPYFKDRSKPILKPTLLHLQKKSGALIHEWGENFFYMPHGLTIDFNDNIWVTDVAMHQVFKFSSGYGDGKPKITLGKRFEPANGKNNFCKPTGVAVMENGEFFVSDGYCNSRIVHFSIGGNFIKEIDTSQHSQIKYSFGSFNIPHSLTLIEDEICTADRENGRVLCFYVRDFAFSRQFHFAQWGQRLFSIVYSRADGMLYAVNGQQFLKGVNKVLIFKINISSNTLETSFSPENQGFNNAHDIDVSINGNDLYVAEIGPNKIWKYSKEKLVKTNFSSRTIIPDSGVQGQHEDINSLNLYADGWSSGSISYIIISLFTIPIIVLSIMAIFVRCRNGSSFTHFGKSGLKLLLKKHQFERVPTNDTLHDSDSMDSEIEEFALNVTNA